MAGIVKGMAGSSMGGGWAFWPASCRNPRVLEGSELAQVPRSGTHEARFALRDEDVILDANTSESRDVHPGFIGEDHVRPEDEVARGIQRAAVVDREADRMAETVNESALVFRAVDEGSRGGVDGLRGRSGLHLRERGGLRAGDRLVHPALLLRRLPHDDRPGDVGAIHVVRRAKVDDDHVAWLNLPRSGGGVRVRL